MIQLLSKFFLTRECVPTKHSSPITHPLSITEFGAIQHFFPTLALPAIIDATVI